MLTVNLFAFQLAKIWKYKSFVFWVDPLIMFYELVRGTNQEITSKQRVIWSGPAWKAGKSTDEWTEWRCWLTPLQTQCASGMGTWDQLVQRTASALGWPNNAAAASRVLQMWQGSEFTRVISIYWFFSLGKVALSLPCCFIPATSRIVSVQQHHYCNQGSYLK